MANYHSRPGFTRRAQIEAVIVPRPLVSAKRHNIGDPWGQTKAASRAIERK